MFQNVYSENQLFLQQTLTEIVPCSIKYCSSMTCYISAPVAKEHIQKKTQNKVKYAKGLKKGMMCYERWTGAVYCWLTYAGKPSHKWNVCASPLTSGISQDGGCEKWTYIPRNSSSTEHDAENLHAVKLTSVLLGEVDRVNSQTGQGIWVLN